MPDEIRSGLASKRVILLCVRMVCACRCAGYASANNTNTEIQNDKQKNKQDNRS